MPAQLILDVLITVLLVITVGYCFVLNKRLSALRSGQDGLREIIRTLNDATSKAQTGIELLRRSSDSIGQELAGKIKHGRDLADELAMIVESGNNIANRMTAGIVKPPIGNRHAEAFPNPRAELSRVEKAFRRHLEHEPDTTGEIAPVGEEGRKPSEAVLELRNALRAVR